MRKIKIKIPNTSNFSFNIHVSDFNNILTKILAVTNYSTEDKKDKHHFVLSKNNTVYLVGYTLETFAIAELTAEEISGEGIFYIDTDLLKGLLKGKKHVSLGGDDSKLYIKDTGSRYKADCVLHPVLDEHIQALHKFLNVEEKETLRLSSSTIDKITRGIKITSLKNVFISDYRMLSYVKVENGILTVSSYDDFHLALYKSKVGDKIDCTIAMPSVAFGIVDKFMSGEEGTAILYITEMGLRVEYESFTIVLPPVQSSDEAFSLVSNLVDNLKKSDSVFKSKIDGSMIESIKSSTVLYVHGISNPTAVNNSVVFKTKGNKLKLIMSTRNGTASDMFKVDDGRTSEFSLDPMLLSDLISNVTAEVVQLSAYTDKNVPAKCIKIDYKPTDSEVVSLISAIR